MGLYYENVNANKWDFLNEVKEIGDVYSFFYFDGMEIGDKLIINIEKAKDKPNGIYAFGTIISNPRVEENAESHFCGKKSVDVRIEKLSKDKPILNFHYFKNIGKARKVSEELTEKIMDSLGF